MKIRLFLIRHGKTKENEENRYIGRTDSGLSEGGAEEIRRNVQQDIYPQNPDIVFSSPLKRCLDTAGIIFPSRDIVVLSELKEIDFGIFEGKNHSELDGLKSYQKWIDSGGKTTIPEGESIRAFTKRTLEGIRHLEDCCDRQFEARGKSSREEIDAALICHGGTIMALRSALEKGDYFGYMTENGACHMVEL